MKRATLLFLLFALTFANINAQDTAKYGFSMRFYGGPFYPYSGEKKANINLSTQPFRKDASVGGEFGLVRMKNNWRPTISAGYYFYCKRRKVSDSTVVAYPGMTPYYYLMPVGSNNPLRFYRHVFYASLSMGRRHTILHNYSIGWNAGLRINADIGKYPQPTTEVWSDQYTTTYSYQIKRTAMNYASWFGSLDLYVPKSHSSIFVSYTGGFCYYLVYFNIGIHHTFVKAEKKKDAP